MGIQLQKVEREVIELSSEGDEDEESGDEIPYIPFQINMNKSSVLKRAQTLKGG